MSHNLKREQAHIATVNVLLEVIKLDHTEILINMINNARNTNSRWRKNFSIWSIDVRRNQGMAKNQVLSMNLEGSLYITEIQLI